jgi:hypothetical protein
MCTALSVLSLNFMVVPEVDQRLLDSVQDVQVLVV